MNTQQSKHTNNLDSTFDEIASTLLVADKDLYRLCLYEKNNQKRQALITFFAFLTEIEKIPHIASEPHIAVIRLKWWHDEISKSQITENTPNIILHLLAHIDNGFLQKESIIALIEVIQQEKEQSISKSGDHIVTYCKDKGSFTSQILGKNEYIDVFTCLMFVRLARKNKKLTIEDHYLSINKEKTERFIKKIDTYTKIMSDKLKAEKSLTLSVIDLLKLHFS